MPRDLDPDDYRPPHVRAAEREKLEERFFARKPLDEVATLIQGLTYGEMIELAETMWNVRPEGSAITQDSLPALLYRWSKSDLATANIGKPPALLQRNDLRQDQDAKSPGIPARAVVGRVAD